MNNNIIETSNTELLLLDAAFVFDGVISIVQSQESVEQYRWDDIDYLELNVIYKASKNASKFKGVLEKHKTKNNKDCRKT